MNSPSIDLFVEDVAHEAFMKPLILRLCIEVGMKITANNIHIRSARGGHGKVLGELEIYQKTISYYPDLLFIGIDANCKKYNAAYNDIHSKIDNRLHYRSVIACPDPHIEKWYLSDLESFHKIIGVRPKLGRKKCERDKYKNILTKALKDAGYPPTLGGIEFANDIVNGMDLYRAGKSEQSLGNFIDLAKKGFQLLKNQ